MNLKRIILLTSMALLVVSAADAATIDPLLKRILDSDRSSPTIPQVLRGNSQEPASKTGTRLGIWVTTTDQGLSLESKGLLDPGRRSSTRTARWTLAEIREAIKDPSVTEIAPAVRCNPYLDVSVEETNTKVVHDTIDSPPTYLGLTGEGVIVGIVDSGIDLTNDDFLDEQGNTRLISVWDQTVASSDPPRIFSYGKEWMANQINAGQATQFDTHGHGTHVSGIAAGDGSATGNGEPAYRYVGMAPKASIIAVKSDYLTTSIADGVAYIFHKADSLGKPAVVNLSLGTHQCPHDGTDAFAREMSDLTEPGHAVVAAAGNEAGDGIHAERILSAPGSATITFVVPSYSPLGGSENDEVNFSGWYPGGTNLAFTVITPGGSPIGPATRGGGTISVNTPEGHVYIDNVGTPAFNGDYQVYIAIADQNPSNPPAEGTWTIQIDAISTSPATLAAEFDIWNFYSSMKGVSFFQGIDETELVGVPATADSVIAVGAYVSKRKWTAENDVEYGYGPDTIVGEIAEFSSIGPRRDNVIKPEVTAPGMGIGSARSAAAGYGASEILKDGKHVISQGTSMASPHVCGLIALMFEQLGPISTKEIVSRLTSTCRRDAFTSNNIPNPTWGFGKIDAFEATDYVIPVVLLDAAAVQNGRAVEISFILSADAGRSPLPVWRQDPGESTRNMIGVSSSGSERTFTDETLTEDGEYLYWLSFEEAGTTNWIGPARISYVRPRLYSLWVTPNPFIDAVQIHWTVPTSHSVISIFDISGRLVRTIPKTINPGGSYLWDGTNSRGENLPAGLYVVRLRTKDGKNLRSKVMRLE